MSGVSKIRWWVPALGVDDSAVAIESGTMRD